MALVCKLTNHIPTFEYSWGICGAIVCSWLSKMAAGKEVTCQEDLGAVSSLILAQHKAMKGDEEESRRKVFNHFGFNEINKATYNAAGSAPLYNHNNFAIAASKEGCHYLSICYFNHNDDPQQHAIGAFMKDEKFYLCDANFGIWKFDSQADFVDGIKGLTDDMYEVLSGSVYHLA